MRIVAETTAEVTAEFREEPRVEHNFCPIYESINLLQEKWTLHIVRSLLDGSKGFNELGRDIGGCNPTTLTQRLERLETAGIIHKSVQSTMPPRTRYTLTEAGRALEDVVNAVDRWGQKFLAQTIP